MQDWFIVYFKQKRFANGSAWTTYISSGSSPEEAIQRVEHKRYNQGFPDWRRTEDTEAEAIPPDDWKEGVFAITIAN